MRRSIQFALLLTLGLSAANGAGACSGPPEPFFKIDKPISISPDGSFENASINDNYRSYGGKPIVDVGNGRVAQRLYFSNVVCTRGERLLFVDCMTLEMIIVEGIDRHVEGEMEIAGFFGTSITNIQQPIGPIRLSRMTVGQVAAISKEHGYDFTVDVRGELAKMRKKNRFDPLMGCKIFYPDSEGAKG